MRAGSSAAEWRTSAKNDGDTRVITPTRKNGITDKNFAEARPSALSAPDSQPDFGPAAHEPGEAQQDIREIASGLSLHVHGDDQEL